MRLVRKINEQGFLVEEIAINSNDVLGENCIEDSVPQGLHKPKWDGSKWDEGFKQKMRERQTGSNNAVAVIDEDIAFEIKIKLMNHNKRTDIAKEFNIDYAVVKSILENKTWKHVYVDGWEDFVREYNKNKQKLLLDEQVREIRCYLEQGLTANKISAICNVGCSVVYAIKQNRTYKNVI
jgi:DNA invertase Pin-like site-specific DNA recombinase